MISIYLAQDFLLLYVKLFDVQFCWFHFVVCLCSILAPWAFFKAVILNSSSGSKISIYLGPVTGALFCSFGVSCFPVSLWSLQPCVGICSTEKETPLPAFATWLCQDLSWYCILRGNARTGKLFFLPFPAHLCSFLCSTYMLLPLGWIPEFSWRYFLLWRIAKWVFMWA